MSKTAASRHWIDATATKIVELRERDLRQTAFFGLILDGVFVGDGAVVLIALGLTCTGEKMLLDFEVGSSENAVVSTALVARLQRRGFGPSPGCRLFAVLDGAVALESAVLALWPDACVQRCLVHKERNLYGYLRKGDHAEAARLWQRLRLAQGEAAGREALAQLRTFLLPLNAAATASLDEAGETLLTLHKLNVPATLNRSLLSTNAIENVMRNYRGQTAKVSRWSLETNQLSRWTATAPAACRTRIPPDQRLHRSPKTRCRPCAAAGQVHRGQPALHADHRHARTNQPTRHMPMSTVPLLRGLAGACGKLFAPVLAPAKASKSISFPQGRHHPCQSTHP
jgi:putative transposase